ARDLLAVAEMTEQPGEREERLAGDFARAIGAVPRELRALVRTRRERDRETPGVDRSEPDHRIEEGERHRGVPARSQLADQSRFAQLRLESGRVRLERDRGRALDDLAHLAVLLPARRVP